MSEVAKEVSLYGFEFRDVDNRRTGRPKCHDIKQLWQRSHEILGLALQGLKQKEIAKILNVTEVTVSNTLNSSLGKQKLAKMRKSRDEHFEEVSAEIQELTMKALNTYHAIFDSPQTDFEMKKKTADTVTLDIAGMRAPTRIDSRSVSYQATKEEIEAFKARGKQAAKESGLLVEVLGEGKGNDRE